MTETIFVTLNIRILRALSQRRLLFGTICSDSRGFTGSDRVLDHLEVDLRYIRSNHVSAAAVDDCVVALSFVLILDEPERCVYISRLVNTEISVKLSYLIHFLFK